MRFIGVDLAWGDRNPTGLAVLEGDARGAALACPPVTVTGVAAVAAAIATASGDGPAFVGVDAPLRVPNATGRRAGEADLARDFARYYAGAHPANRNLAAWRNLGYVTGERLVELLREGHRFEADPQPATDARSARRLLLEVYPHPAQVVLFGLARRIAYKHGPPERRRAGLTRLRALIAGVLPCAEPSLVPNAALGALCAVDLTPLRGRALKGYEDRLDALICAYVAFYYWYWGEQRCRLYGTVADGYVLTPRPHT